MSKLSKAISNPELVRPYLEANANVVTSLVSRGRIDEAIAYLPGIVGVDTYTPYMARKATDGYVEREILGSRMLLDPHDPGISQDLLMWGIREQLPMAAYQEALEDLSKTVAAPVTVLDIGANIGYYLIAARQVLGESARFYGIEPHPDNLELLDQNLALNDYSATTVQGAIGAETGNATLHVSDNSNKHRVDGQPEPGTEIDTLEVQQWSIDDFIETQGLSPTEVHVLRMDVEGHELEVLQGAPELLAADSPLVVFVEIHLGLLADEQLEALVQLLDDASLEIAAAFYDPPLLEGQRLPISDLSELPDQPNEGIQVILQRNIGGNDADVARAGTADS